MRSDWTDLPGEIRKQIEAHSGPIHAIEEAPTGNHADIAATLHTADGPVFVKAARKLEGRDGPEVMSLRREAAVNPHVAEFAPRLRWQAEAGGWLALGFEHVDGRRADFTPGSPDLEVLTKTIHAIQNTPCPGVPMLPAERRWQRYTDDPARFGGGALLHTDLNEDNLIITPGGRVYVVDWAFVTRGAAWLELMMLVPWLINAGHSPQAADEWVCQFPSWVQAPPAAVDVFTAGFAAQWRDAAQARPEEWIARHADLTGRWAAYRLEEQHR
jgi:hypothetical protein